MRVWTYVCAHTHKEGQPVVLDFREHGVNVGIKTVLGFEDHEIKICTSMHLP